MKAVVLVSGGLDSALAFFSVIKQGIYAVGVYFHTPFFRRDACGDISSCLIDKADGRGELIKVSLGRGYLKMVKDPKYGYGGNFNPCIDCKIFMIKEAKKIMDKTKASFLVTGEVLGQRPMSQNRQALETIDKESGISGLVLRPLSAGLLAETVAEKNKWVKDDFLFKLNGRGRAGQLRLAAEWGINGYYQPAGGCLLTESGFCRKIRDAVTYGDFTLDGAELLKVGRHFRLNAQSKLVVGKNCAENEVIYNIAESGDVLFDTVDCPGPLGLARGRLNDEDTALCAKILAAYTKSELARMVKVRVMKKKGKEEMILTVHRESKTGFRKFMV